MGEEVPDWAILWGAKVKMPTDMPDDMMKDAIETVRDVLEQFPDFESDGSEVVENVKKQFDERWGPHWHVVVGRNFGSFVTHETQRFLYFYIGDKACMLYKAG